MLDRRYYVNNDYTDPELIENPPDKPDITRIQRSILADKPRVTRFPIDWSLPSGMADAQSNEMQYADMGAEDSMGMENSMDMAMDENPAVDVSMG